MDEFSFMEMRAWDQFKIKSYCICDWCESGEIGSRRSSRIPLCNHSGGNLLRQSCQISMMELLCKNSQQPKHVDCFCKGAPPQTSDWILNVHLNRGIINVGCRWNVSAWNSRVQAGVQGSSWDSHYKKSYWWYGNPVCGDLTGRNWIEKDQDHVPPRPVWGKRGEGAVRFCVCMECLWMIGLMVVMLMS